MRVIKRMVQVLLPLALIGGAPSVRSEGPVLIDPSTYSPWHWPVLLVMRQSISAAESARTGAQQV